MCEAVARWGRGEREPGWSSFIRLADALGVDCTAFTQEPAGKAPAGRPRPPKPKEPGKPKRSRGRPRKA